VLEQAIDFRDESEALYHLLEPLDDDDFQRQTQFKGWTIDDVIAHLHLWNRAADLSLRDEARFVAFMGELGQALQSGQGHMQFTWQWLGDGRGRELLEAWRNFYREMADRFAAADPKQRVKWAGPDMSVRSSITARLMETWAHGQEVYDLLGVERVDQDRIRNIADLGVRTYGWTFKNRGLDVPEPAPFVRLIAPSGATWEWNEPSEDERIEGQATDFCQVVTQVRNVADTRLAVTGENAKQWMAIAQCFAGPPEDPPEPGTRFTKRPE
jgi:uncharacterized protein (TIGR03084 family)